MKERGAILAIKRKAEERKKHTERCLLLVKKLHVGERYTVNTKSYKKELQLVVEIVHYGVESLRVKLLACDKRTRTFFFVWDEARELRSPNGEYTIMYKNIKEYAQWKNSNAPMLINFDYVEDSFKRKLFY